MPPLYYETSDDVYQIDEVSQRLLVYVFLHGETTPESVVEYVGANNAAAVEERVENQLDTPSAGLIKAKREGQATLNDDAEKEFKLTGLTETGELFVEKHRAELAMPAEIAELAKKVASLQLEAGLLDDLQTRVEELEERVSDLED